MVSPAAVRDVPWSHLLSNDINHLTCTPPFELPLDFGVKTG